MALIRPIPSAASDIESNKMFACGTNTSDVSFTSGTAASTGLTGTVDATYLVNTKGFSSLLIHSNNYIKLSGAKFVNGSKDSNIAQAELADHTVDISNTDFIVIHMSGTSISTLTATFS